MKERRNDEEDTNKVRPARHYSRVESIPPTATDATYVASLSFL